METPFTIPLAAFWGWLARHPNCVLRAGTPEAALYDDDDLHWIFFTEEPATMVVQLLRGKRPLAELVLDPEQITYVQALPPERDDEHVFELISEGDHEPFAAYYFVLVHGYGADEEPPQSRVH